jgi:hypothetical protein
LSPAEFFGELAGSWSGWKGTKGWQALEGECSLSATTDSTGHVTLVAHFSSGSYPPTWEGKLSLVIEAGALEALAREAKNFFGPVHARAGA